jgi:hypothetical protein
LLLLFLIIQIILFSYYPLFIYPILFILFCIYDSKFLLLFYFILPGFYKTFSTSNGEKLSLEIQSILGAGVYSCLLNGKEIVLKFASGSHRPASYIDEEAQILTYLNEKKICGIPQIIASGHSPFGRGILLAPLGESLVYGRYSNLHSIVFEFFEI